MPFEPFSIDLNNIRTALSGNYISGLYSEDLPLPDVTEGQFIDNIRPTHPTESTALREAQAIITRRQRGVEEVVSKLGEQYVQLIHRLQHKSEEGLLKSFQHAITGKKQGYPSKEELLLFINRVNNLARFDYGMDVSTYFTPITKLAQRLGFAMTLYPCLRSLDEKLQNSPFENHNEIHDELLALIEKFATKRMYFSINDDEEHPFNYFMWNKYQHQLQKDIRALRLLKSTYGSIRIRLTQARVEDDLPTDNELLEIEDVATVNFMGNQRHITLLNLISSLRRERDQIINEKIEFSQRVGDEYREQMQRWRQRILSLRNALVVREGEGFPWGFLPPSFDEVELLRDTLQKCKSDLSQWPSAIIKVGGEELFLDGHDEVLDMLAIFTKDKITKAFINKDVPSKELLRYINFYNKILHRKGSDNITEKIEKLELHLFFYAHNEIKMSQRLHWLRRSYWGPLSASQSTWNTVQTHIRGHNSNFTGERSRKAFQLLGWMDEAHQLTETAPQVVSFNL
jgi:hypothetical protein